MRFPGKRKSKHYFPVAKKAPQAVPQPGNKSHCYVVGIDQTIVDIEAHVDDSVLEQFGLLHGQSLLIDDDTAQRLYEYLQQHDLIISEFAGGTIGNTLHNYSVLADDRSVLLGAMSREIQVGSYGYRYLCNTSARMDLNYLQPVNGPIGRGFTLITPDGERAFGINGGLMNHLQREHLPQDVIENAASLVISSYLMRCSDDEPMKQAAIQAVKWANAADVPVVLTLGTKFLIQDDPQWWREFIAEHVQVLAMNEDEAEALTGENCPVAATNQALDWVDFVLCTHGPDGLYTAGYVDDSVKRETSHKLISKSVAEYNRYEFSRPMRKRDCATPHKVFSHISPYMGGPEKIRNTNGAGDAALAAILHDFAANNFHKQAVPGSSKHELPSLSYSSFSQLCKYANRVSYEVLAQHSPRLSRGLPEREDSLEESYWEW